MVPLLLLQAALYAHPEQLVEIKYSFAKAVRDAKIKDLRFHDLRHTAATRMGDAGADAFTLAAIFGWSDIRMAMRYTHAMEDAKRRAVEAIAQLHCANGGHATEPGGTPAVPVRAFAI